MTRIGLISDVHATPAPVEQAVSIFKQQGVDLILCAGDIAGYGDALDETVEVLIDSDCKAILGNHELWALERAADSAPSLASEFFRTLPTVREIDIENKKLYMVHASPPDSCMEGIKLLDETGTLIPQEQQYWAEQLDDFGHDVLIVGHTHQMFAERLADTLVINPGSTKFNHSCAILELPEMRCEWFALSGKAPERVWNWGAALKQGMFKP